MKLSISTTVVDCPPGAPAQRQSGLRRAGGWCLRRNPEECDVPMGCGGAGGIEPKEQPEQPMQQYSQALPFSTTSTYTKTAKNASAILLRKPSMGNKESVSSSSPPSSSPSFALPKTTTKDENGGNQFHPHNHRAFMSSPYLSKRSGTISRKTVFCHGTLLILCVIAFKSNLFQDHRNRDLEFGTLRDYDDGFVNDDNIFHGADDDIGNMDQSSRTTASVDPMTSSSPGNNGVEGISGAVSGVVLQDQPQGSGTSSGTDGHAKKRRLWRRKFPFRPSLHLVGERHSGTNWMTNHLVECFGNQVDFVRGYSTFKHWFQVDETYGEIVAASTTNASTTLQGKATSSPAVVVAQFRNVLDWTEAMRFDPYGSPNHFNLNWFKFVTKPWTMPRYGEDVPFENLTVALNSNVTCRNHCSSFKRPHEIIPCLANNTFFLNWNGRPNRKTQALYEMDPKTGLPYPSILALRSAKIRNFLSVGQFSEVKSFHALRYEYLVRNGTVQLIRELEHELNATADCQPILGDRSRIAARPYPLNYVEYMDKHVDWETEALVGYFNSKHEKPTSPLVTNPLVTTSRQDQNYATRDGPDLKTKFLSEPTTAESS
ncbi:hypothetical protein ACA910_009625 [Epithemia clementina (nom. ined.)]